jgi:hypothetical protein
MVKAIYCWKPISRRPIGRQKTRWVDDVRKDIQKLKDQTGRLLPKLEEDGKNWLRRPKLYKRVVEPHKEKTIHCSIFILTLYCKCYVALVIVSVARYLRPNVEYTQLG